MGADLAAIDLARFLRDQRITETSTAFIFTRRGGVIALPDATRIAKVVHPGRSAIGRAAEDRFAE
jgi:hypothetical protein